jgi:hypothetical protein
VNELQTMLRGMASAVEPDHDALRRVLMAVRRRKHRRRVVALVTSMSVVAGGLAAAAMVRRAPSRPLMAMTQLTGTRPAMELRAKLGIRGGTKGAPPAVVVPTRTRTGSVKVSLVEPSGTSIPLPDGTASGASVSPNGDVVAAVTGDQLVITATRRGHEAQPLVVQGASGTTGSVSWDRGGSGLFAPVGGRWVRVSDPGGASTPSVRDLSVPTIPGGPILLSVSPAGNLVLLFGITYGPTAAPQPHLFLGDFDGTTVSNIRPVAVPDQALSGPLGWVGDNAFILSDGPGRATMVRTDDGAISIQAQPMEDPCKLVPTTTGCTQDGPWLLGTNGDGSLLLWQVSALSPSQEAGGSAALAAPAAQTQPLFVFYFKTWLDGTHAVRLTGELSRYGPPVAAR